MSKDIDETTKKMEEKAKKVAEKVSEEASEKVEETAEEFKEVVEEASKEIEKAGEKAAKEIKAAGEQTEDLLVEEDAPVVGKSVEEIDEQGLIGENALLVEIKRGEENVTPKGDTVVEAKDLITVKSSEDISDKTRKAFGKTI